MNYAEAIKSTVLEFINDLRLAFPEKSPMGVALVYVNAYFCTKDAATIARDISIEVLPHVDRIKRRDDAYFINNAGIFKGLPPDKVEEVSKKWVDGSITPEDKEVIWSYFDTLIALSRKWVETKR